MNRYIKIKSFQNRVASVYYTVFILTIFLIFSCKKNQQDPVPTLSFNSSNLTCEKGNNNCINVAISSIPNGGSITYSIADPTIATVNASTGAIIGLLDGTTTVTAKQAALQGVNQMATASYTLSISLPTPTLRFSTPNNLSCYTGSSSCSNIATSSISNGGSITYSIDKPTIATVNSATGSINPLASGSATVTATQAAKTGINQLASASYILTIADPVPLLTFTTPGNFSCELGNKLFSNIATSTIPTGGVINYSIDKNTIASINSSNGDITPLSIGTAIVTATQIAKTGVNQLASANYTLNVTGATIKLSPSNNQSLNYLGNSYVIQVVTGVPWTATSNSTSWCTISSGSGTGDGSFVVICSPYNSVGNSRSATVTVSGQGGNPVSTLNFLQFPYPPNPTLVVSNGVSSGNILSMTVNKLGSSLFTISVTSNVAWTASSGNSTWCGANATGFGNGTFQISCASNAAGSPRSATVSITGSGGSPTATITVLQN